MSANSFRATVVVYLGLGMVFMGLASGYRLHRCPLDRWSDMGATSDLAFTVLTYPVVIVAALTFPPTRLPIECAQKSN